MRSGELARMAHVSTDTLRYYERLQLLPHPQRSTANYRHYPASALTRVRLIQQALAIRFSLTDLQLILSRRDSGNFPCRHVRRLLAEKIREVAQEQRNLALFHKQLRRLAQDWDRRITRAGPSKPALLLEQIPTGIRDPRRNLQAKTKGK